MANNKKKASSIGSVLLEKFAFKKPAFQAFFIQILAHLATVGIARGIWTFTNWQLSITLALLLQGIIAATITRYRNLASWWIVIQFFFPISLITAYTLHLPPWIFLVTFIFLLSLYWTTFRTQVPFYPSGPATWEAVLTLLPKDRPIRFVDIGSGLGGLVLNLAVQRPESMFMGIEIAPLPWFVSWLRQWVSRSSGDFLRGDYKHLDFSQYDVVFAYLSPAVMPAIWEKASAEMRPATLLMSYEFILPNIPPHCTVSPKPGAPLLYAWYF